MSQQKAPIKIDEHTQIHLMNESACIDEMMTLNENFYIGTQESIGLLRLRSVTKERASDETSPES